MRSLSRTIALGLIAIALGGCSSADVQDVASSITTPEATQSQPLDGLVGTYVSDWSFCIEAFQADRVSCSIGYTVENPTDAPVEIMYANIYAVVDGKIFKADADQGNGISSVSTNWNPGDKFTAMTAFTVPTGSTIEQVFFADEPRLENAEMIFDVGVVANPS